MSDENTELCEAVQLVLKRMDSNPEEFLRYAFDPNTMTHNKWATLIEQHWECLTEHERKTLKDKKAEIKLAAARKSFHDAVMEQLLVGEMKTVSELAYERTYS